MEQTVQFRVMYASSSSSLIIVDRDDARAECVPLRFTVAANSKSITRLRSLRCLIKCVACCSRIFNQAQTQTFSFLRRSVCVIYISQIFFFSFLIILLHLSSSYTHRSDDAIPDARSFSGDRTRVFVYYSSRLAKNLCHLEEIFRCFSSASEPWAN